jgi:inhibitor of cysteine peptidase
MLRVLRGLCVIVGLLILAACGVWGPDTVQVREQDSGGTVELHRGDRLVVVLEGNPTTGYVWEQVAGDAAVIGSAGEPTFTPESQALGAGGTVSVPFTAVGAGQTTLKLAYHRTFEPGVPPLKTFEVTAVVR